MFSSVRGRLASVSRGRAATVVAALLVVVAMVAVADLAARSADLHRRAQVVVEQIRASGEEMSAFKWMANTEVLEGTADFSLDGPLVRAGVGITSQLDAKVAELEKLAPGPETTRLYEAASVARGNAGALSADRRSARQRRAAGR